ncbi:response regulator [Leptolyngbya sp. NIES-2104]|uniref:response regulator n=1 Tax=Leptolyngbya sp. NIES-2104 TaxID=1552121 RepID=UPI0006EC9A61|nr:response regulator [Leptolyngbya sp. NIES-2104]GAP94946.1 two-component hybrid sensor and regulator [Leptolyngbya sp. NIES-2104]
MSNRLSNQHPLRALVVDDDLDSVILLTTVLEMYGIDVIAATCATQAMNRIRSLPDILIADLAMPLMDGFDLIRQVRALPQNQGGEIPAIAVSAWAAIEAQERAIASGFQRFLGKPYQHDELIDMVSQLTGWKVTEFAA